METTNFSFNDVLVYASSFQSESQGQELLLVPDNLAEIIIPLDQTIQVRILGTAKYVSLKPTTAYFLSPRRRGMEIRLEPNSSFYVLKINPIFTKSVQRGLSEVSSGIFDFLSPVEVLDRLQEALKTNKYVIVSDWINSVMAENNEPKEVNITVANSIDRIKDASGSIKVKELYTTLNVSKSKLEQHFNRELGMTPKEFCRIEKINNFIRCYRSGFAQSLTELTYKCGYYDQSHLIKDFRYFLETSPKKFFTEQMHRETLAS